MTAPWLNDGDVRLYLGDALEVLAALPDESVDACVTSPPYWGLRDYGVDGQLGLEASPAEYVARIVEVFREVRRVLTTTGTFWLNLGDSYAAGKTGRADHGTGDATSRLGPNRDGLPGGSVMGPVTQRSAPPGLKPKDLVGVPWRVALALQDDGWWLRKDIIWHKPNPMPESVRDRPTSAHEHIFMLAKAPDYYYDAVGIAEPVTTDRAPSRKAKATGAGHAEIRNGGTPYDGTGETRNARDVWTIAHQPYSGAHFAVFPPELARRCIIAGAPERVCAECGRPSERIVERTAMVTTAGPGRVAKVADQGDHARTACGGTVLAPATATTTGWSECGCNAGWRRGIVLDPFAGSGTTLQVARDHGRHAVGIELNADYARLAAERLAQQSLLGGAA